MKIYTDFDFAEFPDSKSIDKDVKMEYIRQMINLAQEDKKSVYPYVVFNVGAIVFIISNFQKSFLSLPIILSLISIFGILLLISSSVSFFWYWRKIHKCQINLVSCIPDLNICKTKELWIDLWSKNKVLFKLGLIEMIIGIICSFLIFIDLIK